MKDVISSAGMRAGAYGERKTKSMPVAQEQLRGEFFPHAILWKERMWIHLLRQIEKGRIFLGECFVVSTGEEKVGQRYLIMKIKMLQKLKK
ncbi:MAG: hypothetical protein V8Q21_02675 [Akkermansia muciniphila]